MFGRNGFMSNSTDENDTESWSFPSNYERFSTVNVPKSRLGRRRRLDTCAEAKRDVLKGVSEVSNNSSDNGIFGVSHSQDAYLTHPVNSALTPSHKVHTLNTENLHANLNCVGKEEHDKYLGSNTPFRKDAIQPLKEINNFINGNKITPNPVKPPPLKGGSGLKAINVSLEYQMPAEPSDATTNDILSYCGAVSGASHHNADSSQSDVCNNSSFMTAHDIYNPEKVRQQDSMYLKTPRKGFCLLDMLASPVDHVNNMLNSDSQNFKNILSNTPGLSNLESLRTPFRTKGAHNMFVNEMFTPTLINNPKSPMIRNECSKFSSAEKDVDIHVPISFTHSEGNVIMPDIKQPKVESNMFFKTAPSSDDSKSNIDPTELPKSSPSLEIKVKRRIFEGLGWSLPPSSFSPGIRTEPYQIHKPSKDFNSVLLTPTSNSFTSKNINECNSNVTEEDLGFNSAAIVSETQCNEASSTLSLPENNCNDKTSANQLSGMIYNKCSSLPERNSIDQHQTPIPLVPREKEMDIENEVYSDDNIKNSINFAQLFDTGFSTSSVMHTIVNDSSPLKSTEIMSSDVTKDTAIDLEENAVTIQNVPIKEQNMKDITIGTQHSGNSNHPKVTDDLKSGQIEAVDKSNEKHPQSTNQQNSEKCQEDPFVVPSQPPAPGICYPRTQSNVVYVNKKSYTVLSMLGRGGSSEVYQVLDTETSKLMAMKFVNLASVEDSIAVGYLNEIEVLTKLQGCPSVIRMFDSEYIAQSKILYVVMEKGDTDFSRLMKDIMKTKKISMSMITYYWTEMLNCVKDIHEKGIIHSDLKPANFLLVSGRLKLIDFGIASSLQGDMTSVLKDVTTGTFNYMSPEAIRNSGETRGYKITYKSDIWSLGCILYNLLYGRTPFSHLTNTWAKLGAIANPDTNVTFPPDSSVPPHLLISVRWALQKDPKERPTAAELLKLAELTPGAETKLGRQISSLLAEYISQTFPNCSIKF